MLDISQGAVCGVDIVVWPEVTTIVDLRAPDRSVPGRIMVVSRPSRPDGVALVEVDTTLAVQTNPSESVFRLQIGPPRPGNVVQVANHLSAEVDQQGGLVALWLTEVPPFTAFDDM